MEKHKSNYVFCKVTLEPIHQNVTDISQNVRDTSRNVTDTSSLRTVFLWTLGITLSLFLIITKDFWTP